MQLRQLLASVTALSTIGILGACSGGTTHDGSVQSAHAGQSQDIPPVPSALVPQNIPTVVYDNDVVRDTYTDDYVMALASVGKSASAG